MRKFFILLSMAVPLLFGCVSISPEKQSDWLHDHKNIEYLTVESNTAMNNAVQGQSLKIVTRSQNHYELELESSYFAASGNECFDTSAADAVIVCRYQGSWGISRKF